MVPRLSALLAGVRPTAAAVVLGLSLVGVNCAAGIALAAEPLGTARARALLTRAGFAPSAAEVERIAPLTHRAAVDRLLAETQTVATRSAPRWIDEPIVTPRELRSMTDDERQRARRTQIAYGLDLRGWWLQEMASTPTPLTERMTLFWHNHFVSAQPKVRAAQLMYRQNVLLRRHALGNFGTLLHQIARDPAMLVYLDGATSRKQKPNENFAREVMELFTLGEGHYTEADIKEAARAFTGWSINPQTASFTFRAAWHDRGEKSVLGQRGRFDGDDVLNILLAQPATADLIVAKLWREFVSPQPDPQRVQAIAARFRADYEIAGAVRALLLQPEVITRSEDNALVKSPVELLIGLARQFDGALAPRVAALAVAGMGQNLFSAPNVRGWPGGEAWITTQTLLVRKLVLERSVRAPNAMATSVVQPTGANPADADAADLEDGAARRRLLALIPPVHVPADRWLALSRLAPDRIVGAAGAATAAEQLLVLAPTALPQADSLGLDALRALLLDPVYQLK
jgi:uncharacterized protein (DUF1800 family)